MVNRNIQMKKREGNEWENLFPLTLDENIYDNDGISLETYKQTKETELQELADTQTAHKQALEAGLQEISDTQTTHEQAIQAELQAVSDTQTAYTDEELEKQINTTKINAKYPPETYEPVVADGVTDDTQALQTLINDFNYIELPKGTIKISDTIRLKSYLHVEGAYSETIITSDVPDLTLLLGNRYDDEGTDFSHSSLKNIQLTGNDINQIGYNIRGYQSKIEKVYIKNMGEPFITGGVMVEYNDMFVINNQKSGHLLSPPTNFNTMLYFYRVEFHSNKGALTHDSSGSNTVGLTFDTCVFEQTEGRPLELDVHTLTIRNTWFERNTQRPLINNYRVILERNRYEVTPDYPDQSPEWIEGTYEGEGKYRGRVEIGNRDVSARVFNIQQYGLMGDEYTPFDLQATGQENERKLFTNVNGGTEYFMTGNNKKRLKTYGIKVNASGSMAYSDLEEIGVSCNRTATGVYEINFDSYIDHREVNTQVQLIPDSRTTDIIPSISFNNKTNGSDYNQWYNQIIVKGYELTGTEPVGLSPTNVIVNILLFGNNL